VWQYAADKAAAKTSGWNCYLGKITADSCVYSPGVWVGGARPSPNQLFTIDDWLGGAIKSTLQINVTLPGAIHRLCF
jgi:hypothetical protein